ncbi:pH-response regulator protein-like protein palC [Neofusicoccum parvum]|uniref:PH-response regulator protein-like protein palC n=1 Tax=Neofusicoccum parvum TaxID=310453 RepID=A0ACB5S2A0_9PEZI|nr:pH-response regulator protein-like protein palC [Neofusicoccum parvum]
MPFPFELPTTSSVSFTDHYTSTTHPSLPLAATTARGVLRDVLKKHKRLPPPSQTSNLPAVTSALTDYLPYLTALDAGLRDNRDATDPQNHPHVTPTTQDLAVAWRATLTPSPVPGRAAPRLQQRGLGAEQAFALSTLGFAHALGARAALHALQATTASPAPEQRAAAVAAAMRAFLDAHAVHAFVAGRPPAGAAVDVSPGVQAALAELALAEATLVAVLKDDPYPGVVAEDRARGGTEWMWRAPEIPKVRAHLFARLCLAAAEHAARGAAGLGKARVEEGLGRYLEDLRRTARGKACRFLGIDAELAGRTGEGIAWLRAARRELGFGGGAGAAGAGGVEEEKKKGFASRLKKDWAEKREDRKIEKGADWGSDAGRFEEGRVVEMLEKKWVKMNDTVGVQPIPPVEPLLANLPSGREYHTPKPYRLPALDASTVTRMRAPPDPSDPGFAGNEDDSADEDERLASSSHTGPAGAFPGTAADYGGDRNYY